MFFFLDEKEPKNQAKTPNPFFVAQKAFTYPAEKLGFRTVLAKPTPYYQRTRILYANVFVCFK